MLTFAISAANDPRPVSEGRARAKARRAGYILRKSRRQLSLDNYGGFMIVDSSNGVSVAGWAYDYDAADVIDWLEDS